MFETIIGHDKQKKWLESIANADRVQPLWLFGPKGIGKAMIAREMALAWWKVLIPVKHEDRKPEAMGPEAYEQYMKWVSNNHPDLKIFSNPRPGINEIRQLLMDTEYMPYEQDSKIYIMDNIEYSTAVFQVLLKTLEEGSRKYCRFILISHGKTVPATIQSRCIKISFEKLSDQNVDLIIRKVRPEIQDTRDLVKLCNGSVGIWLKLIQTDQQKEVYKTVDQMMECLKRGDWANLESLIGHANGRGISIWVFRYLAEKLVNRLRAGIQNIGGCSIKKCIEGFDLILNTEGIDKDRFVRNFIVEISQ